MEEERLELFDASSYMLFEASGDSEAGFSDAEDPGAATAAEDDAQSCICGWAAAAALPVEDEFYDAECNEVEEDGGGTEVEDGVVNQFCGGGGTATEETTDRLFWEACLAS
ncbi:hypothetical protein ACS0TY_012811 [Phlomoides rotata]